MKNFLFLLISMTIGLVSFSQVDSIQVEEDILGIAPSDTVYMKPEQMPIFPGCEGGDSAEVQMCTIQAMMRHAFENFKYPAVAREHGLTGKVYISFVINTKGEVVNIKVLKGVHRVLDQACIDAVKSFPIMTPGYQLGEKVNVAYTIPFNIQADKKKKKKKKKK